MCEQEMHRIPCSLTAFVFLGIYAAEILTVSKPPKAAWFLKMEGIHWIVLD